uniref:Uncharacterized protein n=1 Tax=Elysia chlorotica TaxID=188477 RepID=A0A1S5V2N5_ELYCH|nr:hypothetical protein [Elysia chlorotica]
MVKGVANSFAAPAKILGDIASGPGAFAVCSFARRFLTSSVEIWKSSNSSLYLQLGGSGTGPGSSLVNTLWKNVFSRSVFSLSEVVFVPSGFNKSATPVMVFVFDFTYFQKALGFDFASFAIFVSCDLCALLQAALA